MGVVVTVVLTVVAMVMVLRIELEVQITVVLHLVLYNALHIAFKVLSALEQVHINVLRKSSLHVSSDRLGARSRSCVGREGDVKRMSASCRCKTRRSLLVYEVVLVGRGRGERLRNVCV